MPFKRNGKWYSDFRPRVGGKLGARVRKLLPGCATKDEARKAENRLANRLSGGAETEPAPLLTDFLNDTYLVWARANKAAPELDERHAKLFCASRHLRGRRMDEVSVIQIEGYKRERTQAKSKWGRSYKPGTINDELTTLARAFRLAVDSGLGRANPCRLVARLPDSAPCFRVLERDEEARLFAALADGPDYVLPLGRAALLTGLRLGELLTLRKPDLDFGRDLLFLSHAKWQNDPRKDKGLPLDPLARAPFLSLCAPTKGLLFTRAGQSIPLSTASNAFRAAAERAGLKGLHPHSLRHTFGTRLGEAGASPYEIARLMGHANIQTSMIYVHPSATNLHARVAAANSGHYLD